MRRKKQLLRSLPSLNERELTLVWRDIRRAADVAAIGGASSEACDNYIEVGHVIERECEKRFGKKPEDYLNREGGEELVAIYKKIYSKAKGKNDE